MLALQGRQSGKTCRYT